MYLSFNTAVLLQDLLCIQQAVQAGINGEFRELPFDDSSKPHQRTHIKEFDWTETFLGIQNLKPGIPELSGCDVQILLRERQFSFTA